MLNIKPKFLRYDNCIAIAVKIYSPYQEWELHLLINVHWLFIAHAVIARYNCMFPHNV